MLKKKYLIFILFAVIGLISSVILYNDKNEKNIYINSVLHQESYTYLPKEAKKYIKEVYEETGEVVKTEKNKEDNVPYLNPKYIEYLELSDEEQEKVVLIPDLYVLDYEVNKGYSTKTLPSSYDLRNVDGKNYISSIKNQGTTEICWAFATIENVETLLMKQKNQSYTDQFHKFSIRQLDYVTSTDSLVKDASWTSCINNCIWQVYDNKDNGSRKIGKGGNFFTSSIIMANALSLTDESILPWTEKNYPKWPKDIMGYDKSLYEVNSTIQMPTINEDSATEELISSYVNDVKEYMTEYGGPFVGTYSPKSTCGFENTDGTKAMKTDDCANDASNKDLGHAMQIIGWDDNYEYSYCDAGTKHYAVKNGSCTSGELTKGKGVWVLRNSWGEDSEEGNTYKYVYLTYDSTRLSIGFTTSVSEMANRTWNNNYHSNPWIESNISNGMASVNEQTKEFDTHNNKLEKIEKIKFATASKNGKYTLSIITGDNVYNDVAVVNSNEVGIYTVDLSNKNIILENNKFSVKIVGENEDKFYNNSLSVFTSNIDTTPMVTTYSSKAYDSTKSLSNDNPLYVSGDNYWYLTVNTYLKNIPSNADLTYRIKQDDGVIATERQIADFKKTIINDFGEANFSGSYSQYSSYFNTREAYGKTYTFEVVYDDVVVDSFPIKFSGKGATTKSTIRLHANNGTDYYYDVKQTDKTTFTFKLSDVNSKDFYNNGYYITSWNTRADGTGESYNVDETALIYHDMNLYAQWSNKTIDVKFNFKCKYSDNCSGTMNSITANIDDSITFPENHLTNDGYKFTVWTIDDRNHYELQVYEQEKRSVSQLLRTLQNSYNKGYFVFNNIEIDVDAYWSDSSKTIIFNANGGTGTMKSINLETTTIVGIAATHRIKDNLFTRNGYAFTSWNTEADGTGTSYTSTILIEDDITLYAQWEVAKGKITYNSNYGDNEVNVQDFTFNVDTKLDKNTFTRTDFMFKEWNTKHDGTGTSYLDCQTINKSDNLILYAIWEKNTIIPDDSLKNILEDNGYSVNGSLTTKFKIGDSIASIKNKLGSSVIIETDKEIIATGVVVKKENESYTIVIKGDLNGDGRINSADLLQMRKYLLEEINLTGAYKEAGIIESNGEIKSLDLLRLRQYLLDEYEFK